MFDPPNLLEQRHFELNSALGRLDAEKVRAVLAAEPLSAQPMAGWRSSPLQTLVSQGYLLTNEKLEPWTQCLLALVKAGADINQGHGYGSSPIQTLLGQGNHRAISILAQVGALGRLLEDGVRGQAALLSVFRAQHGGGMAEHSYPLSAMVRVLLEVGANAAGNASSYGWLDQRSYTHNSRRLVGSSLKQELRLAASIYSVHSTITMTRSQGF
jgi:ankyrin repeat protein